LLAWAAAARRSKTWIPRAWRLGGGGGLPRRRSGGWSCRAPDRCL